MDVVAERDPFLLDEGGGLRLLETDLGIGVDVLEDLDETRLVLIDEGGLDALPIKDIRPVIRSTYEGLEIIDAGWVGSRPAIFGRRSHDGESTPAAWLLASGAAAGLGGAALAPANVSSGVPEASTVCQATPARSYCS